MKTPIDKAIQAAGGLNELAKRIDASPTQICNWRTRGTPVDYCCAIESAVNGVVTRVDLRPNDHKKIWPEFVTKAKKVKP